MNLHKLLMGKRWEELPPQTLLDEKVSKYIGCTLLGLMVVVGVQTLIIVHQDSKIQNLQK